LEVGLVDRNFCVRDFICGIEARGAYFISRQHQGLSWEALSTPRYRGQTQTGKVYEQRIQVVDTQGKAHKYRRLRVSLNKPTRDGESELFILTNLPEAVASAKHIAEMYRKRWRIETMFQELEGPLHSEINTLGYPKAALFGFCVALVAYNVLAVVKAALRNVHGDKTIDNEVSGYYLAGNIARTYDGMMIAVGAKQWVIFHTMTFTQLAQVLLELAANVKRQCSTLIAAMAELESSLISERVTAGMKAAKARGKQLGRPRTPQPFVAQIERLAKMTDLSVRQIHGKMDAKVSRGIVGDIVKRVHNT
jgi:hypothetical protein